MPLFSEALRDSKLFSLPPKSVARRIKSPSVPKAQVLAAPSASAHRRDWGLKFPVAGPKRKQVEFHEFEDNMRTSGVDVRPYLHRNVANLEDVGAPITFSRNQRLNSLFDVAKPDNLAHKRKGLQFMSDSEFAQKLREARAAPIPEGASPERALREIGVQSSMKQFSGGAAAATPVQWQNSSIGATYAPPGVLHNTPRGVLARKPVAARAVPMARRQGAIAFGGFIASNHSTSGARAQTFQKTQRMTAQQVNGTPSGNLQIYVNTESEPADEGLQAGYFLDRQINVK